MNEKEIKSYYERIEKLLNGANKETYGFVPEEIRNILRCYEILQKQNQQLNKKINKAIEYYETYKQESVIGRNKDEKLIKDYYLPAQCSKKLMEILKGE